MTTSLTALKRQGYAMQRTASLGAAVTLLSGCGSHSALFECATHIASVLGTRELQDLGDGLLEYIPYYVIPNELLNEALLKITKKFSVALVEYIGPDKGFVALWRINRVVPAGPFNTEIAPYQQELIAELAKPLPSYLDEY